MRLTFSQCNIRVLGGLLSAHILATDSKVKLAPGLYNNQLLDLAEDLGQRFLCAFDTPTGLPYAWINLKVLFIFVLHEFCQKLTDSVPALSNCRN